jgi:hypothetical protein
MMADDTDVSARSEVDEPQQCDDLMISSTGEDIITIFFPRLKFPQGLNTWNLLINKTKKFHHPRI